MRKVLHYSFTFAMGIFIGTFLDPLSGPTSLGSWFMAAVILIFAVGNHYDYIKETKAQETAKM